MTTQTMTMDAGLKRAITEAGGIRPLAKKLGISQVAVWKWEHVPVHRLWSVAHVTGIPAHELRPDLASLFFVDHSSNKQRLTVIEPKMRRRRSK